MTASLYRLTSPQSPPSSKLRQIAGEKWLPGASVEKPGETGIGVGPGHQFRAVEFAGIGAIKGVIERDVRLRIPDGCRCHLFTLLYGQAQAAPDRHATNIPGRPDALPGFAAAALVGVRMSHHPPVSGGHDDPHMGVVRMAPLKEPHHVGPQGSPFYENDIARHQARRQYRCRGRDNVPPSHGDGYCREEAE